MQRAINHKHRPRLRRMGASRLFVDIAQRLDHARAARRQTEHPIGQQAKVARPRIRDHAHHLLAIFHIVPHRGTVVVIHACVHGKAKGLACLFQRGVYPVELPKGPARIVIQKQAQFLTGGIDLAYRVPIALRRQVATLGGPGRSGHYRQNQEGQTHHSSASRRTSSTTTSCASIRRVSSIRSNVSSSWKRRSGANFNASFLDTARRSSPLLRASSLTTSSWP
mmetsp:Transcript_1706/g.2902  ORF Transcript_1706/g.2902 Transcript_1706/m.2902 type:complete len:223 (-) Transcript_1706:198-866(-)